MTLILKPAVRRQSDDKQEFYSELSAIEIDSSKPTENLTRQEQRDSADINKLLYRFGVQPGEQRRPFYGEVDYDIDLQTAISATHSAEAMFNRLPIELRQKYGTYLRVLEAAQTGELKEDLEALKNPPKPAPGPAPEPTPAPVPPAP